MDPRAIADLERSGLTPDAAEAAGIFYIEDASKLYPARPDGTADFRALPALVLPYYDVDAQPVTFRRAGDREDLHFCRVRYLEEPEAPRGFVKPKVLRYSQAAGSGVRAYFPPIEGHSWADTSQDTTCPVLITEGEKKALSSCKHGFVTLGLGGVYNWKQDGKLLPELDAWNWNGRETFIVFDSDAALNPQIQLAEHKLVDELMQKRGANVFIVRIPAFGDKKVGIDDFLVKQGDDRFMKLLRETDSLGGLDHAVVALNKHVCWVERDGAVYDIDARHFLKSEAFVKGSRYSQETVKVMGTTGRKSGLKEVSVPQTWLTHRLARRYSDILFRPGEPDIVPGEGGVPALNVWHGWQGEEGSIDPFLELHEFIMSRTPEEHRDLPLRLMAYKAQNPHEKIPLACVLVGEQGTGKSMWAGAFGDAFNPYTVVLQSDSLVATFQGWLERSLLAIINEAEAEDIVHGYPRLRALISDVERPMNEKYRVARQIKSFTQYILTANDRAAGAFSADDRRMFVIGCPPKDDKRPPAFYERVAEWRKKGGGRHLLHWLLTVDLEGWRPPAEAPMTAEKAMAHMESLTTVEKLAAQTKTATTNTIVLWLEASLVWANQAVNNQNLARHAQEIIDGFGLFPIRDWYTADELAMIFPHVAATLYGVRGRNNAIPGEISRQFRNCGVRFLECADNPQGFLWKGRRQQFLVVANRDEWRDPIPQKHFELVMAQWPSYNEFLKQAVKKRA